MKKKSLFGIIIAITAVVCLGYFAFDVGKYIAMYCYPLKDYIRNFFDVVTHLGILLIMLIKHVAIFGFIAIALFIIFQVKKEFSDNGEYVAEDGENKDLNIDKQ